MENFFNLQHKLVFNRKDDVFGRFENFCKLSTSNYFAYTSNVDLKTGENDRGFFVYVFDLNLPWYSYKIAARKYPITTLEWDQTSNFLLVADNYGFVSVYTQKNNLIDDWIEIQSISFPSENIIAAKFFFNGVKFPKYQHDQVLYTDKYQKSRIQPAVRAFGTACTGVIVITATGLIGAFSFDINSSTSVNNVEQCQFIKGLGQGRNILTIADIAFKNGQFYVAVANTSQKNPIIQCYRVHIEKIDDELVINSKSLPSFFVNDTASVKDLTDLKLYRLKWMSPEDADALIISSNHLGGSIVEIFVLKEESLPIHKLFQTNKNESYKTLAWSNTQTYRHSRKVLDVITTKVNFSANFYMFIAYTDSTIHCLNREGLKRVSITNVTFSASALEQSSTKIIKMTSKMAALDISFMGCLLLVIDSFGQVCSFKVNFDHIMMSFPQAVNALEYQMISGLDTLDSMLLLKPQMIDQIVDRMTENFNRQPNFITQFYYLKFLTMKINLYRMTISGQNKAHDLICLLNLISISTAFKSLLRPADLMMTTKNGPAENLAMNLSETVNADVDKVLLNLEPKDFTVEPMILQSLQPLIQFVADLALNILVKLPEGRTFLNTNKTTGDLSDFTALNTIRELLVMIRIWGLLKPTCLPVFSRSADNLDILATLFRLLTKLAPKPDAPDESLLDECCLLPSQVLIPQVHLNNPKISLSSPVLSNLQLPLHLTYFSEYENLEFTPDYHASYVEGCLMNHNGIIDSIRYLHLSKSAVRKRCLRCSAFSSLKSIARTSAMKSWENRWDACLCNGKWRTEKI